MKKGNASCQKWFTISGFFWQKPPAGRITRVITEILKGELDQIRDSLPVPTSAVETRMADSALISFLTSLITYVTVEPELEPD